jgi:hypothetical protein
MKKIYKFKEFKSKKKIAIIFRNSYLRPKSQDYSFQNKIEIMILFLITKII